MDELVLMGHSFGGVTAMLTAARAKVNEQPRAVCTMDPWLYPFSEMWNDGQLKIKCPVQVISSEFFHPFNLKNFDSWKPVT